MSKRQRIFGCLLIVWVCLMLAGCTADWVSESKSLIPLISAALGALFSLLTVLGPKIDQKVVQAAQAGFTAVSSGLTNTVLPLIEQYQQATADKQQSILQDIQTALQTIEANWQSVLSTLKISNPETQQKIEEIEGLVAAQIAALVALIPALKSAVASGNQDMSHVLKAVRSAGHELPLSAGQFKGAFNRVLTRKTGDAELDAATPKFVLK